MADENVNPNTSESAVRLVIMAHPGSEVVCRKIWKKLCAEPHIVVTYQGEALSEILENMIADGKVADNFVLVPAGCIPCARIEYSELLTPKVYVTKLEKLQYDSGLPVSFDKMLLADFLPEYAHASDEDFLEAYIKTHLVRPIWVSLNWGNYLSPVKRGTPCMNKVMEALVRKKFITASAEGWKAIEPLLKKTLLAK